MAFFDALLLSSFYRCYNQVGRQMLRTIFISLVFSAVYACLLHSLTLTYTNTQINAVLTITLLVTAVIISTYIAHHFLEYISIIKYQHTKQNYKYAVLVSGGSSGIGLELAKLFIRDEFVVMIVSNDPNHKIQEAERAFKQTNSNAEVVFFNIDLTLGDQARADLFNKIRSRNLIVTHLVNNAGIGTLGEFYKLEWGNIRKTIEVNVLAMTHMSHLFLNEVVQHRKNGIDVPCRIMHTSSMGSLDPVPNFLIYGATKSYIRMMSVGLSHEVEKLGVSVTTLIPGSTATPLLAKSSYDQASWFWLLETLSAEYVAKCGYYHMMKGNVYAVPGIMNKIIRWGMYLAPEFMVCRAFLRAMHIW
jgi:short-subunit dehydrogenase